jgi:hypothetical protein
MLAHQENHERSKGHGKRSMTGIKTQPSGSVTKVPDLIHDSFRITRTHSSYDSFDKIGKLIGKGNKSCDEYDENQRILPIKSVKK